MRWRPIEIAGALALAGVAILVGLAVLVEPASPELVTVQSGSLLQPTPSAAPTEPAPTAEPTPSEAVATPSPSEAPPEPLPTEERASVGIRVLNGGAVSGTAAQVSDQLQGAGFSPGEPGTTEQPADRTLVLYAPGQLPAALAANEVVGAGADAVLESSADQATWDAAGEGLDVLVIVGPAIP